MAERDEIDALIQLLDDSDQEVYSHVASKLLSMGSSVIPKLENAWGDHINVLLNDRIEDLIHQIQFDSLLSEFRTYRDSDEPDPLEGAFLLARYVYPDAQRTQMERELNRLRKNIWLELHDYLTPLEQVNVFNQVFYGIQKFSAQLPDHTDEQLLCINHVIESRKGSSIGLGMLYLVLAQMLELPVYGLQLPSQFILCYLKYPLEVIPEDQWENHVLFYINPVNNGAIFTRNEIQEYLQTLKVDASPAFYRPVSNIRCLHYLAAAFERCYKEKGLDNRVREIRELMSVIGPNR